MDNTTAGCRSSPRQNTQDTPDYEDNEALSDAGEEGEASGGQRAPLLRHKCPKPGCGKSFSRPSHLARHALNHSSTEFGCSRCRASFKRRDLLERHRARHASKDRLAGGLGLGILKTKRRRLGRAVVRTSTRAIGTPLSATEGSSPPVDDEDGAAAVPRQPNRDPKLGKGADLEPGLVQASAAFLPPESPERGLQGADDDQYEWNLPGPDGGDFVFDFHELGDMYHDNNFDALHFDVTGGPDTLLPSSSSTSNNKDHLDSSLDWIGHLKLGNLGLTEIKRTEVLALISDMRPVSPNGALIDESTEELSLARMQDYLDLFFEHFNVCYPMVHSATLEVADAEPLFLLSMMILGATYRAKADHQLSVCIYDAVTPYIMSVLAGVRVPSLSTLQAFLILECYGMYRAGPYQRESAILIRTLLFNAIKRLSRYHVRARIMLPDLLTGQGAGGGGSDWRTFANAEQYTRLILFVFMWDTQNVSYYSFMPSMSTQSIQVSLPCSRELWEAGTETEWKSLTAASYHGRVPEQQPMINSVVKDVVENGGSLLGSTVDSLSLNLILHGLMSMCNDMVHFNNQSIYLPSLADTAEGNDSGDNSSSSDSPWRRLMVHALEIWKMRYETHAMETVQTLDEADVARRQAFRGENVAFLALYHTAQIIASADVRHLQIAAGAPAIFGHVVTRAERDESTMEVARWATVGASPSSAASHAAWHAAHMFREGLLNLRNWKANGMFHYPWCLYVGALTCWAVIHFRRDSTTTRRTTRVCACQQQQGDMQTRSKTLMHQTVSVMASSSPENLDRVLGKCCPHGLAIEVAKYLGAVRWTAAFEAMKVLQALPDMK